MKSFRDLAAELRRLIENGTYQPGQALPTIEQMEDQYGLSRQTIRSALKTLANEGLIVLGRGKRRTAVRDRRRIKIRLSRYGDVMVPNGSGGPWEKTLEREGIPGEMKTVTVDRRPAGQELAALLGVQPGEDVAYRYRHAIANGEVIQVQQAWYPMDIAVPAGLDSPVSVVGGIYGALIGAGTIPATADETVRGRMPTQAEADLLGIGSAVPLLTVERVTKAQDGRVLEVLRATAPADRIEFVYNNLPLPTGGTA